jgi:hypothetical protein
MGIAWRPNVFLVLLLDESHEQIVEPLSASLFIANVKSQVSGFKNSKKYSLSY